MSEPVFKHPLSLVESETIGGGTRVWAWAHVMEGARVYRVLDKPWMIVTGGLGSTRQTEAAHMAVELESLGVPADRIVIEGSWGIGESVVAGTAIPDRWILSRDGKVISEEIERTTLTN